MLTYLYSLKAQSCLITYPTNSNLCHRHHQIRCLSALRSPIPCAYKETIDAPPSATSSCPVASFRRHGGRICAHGRLEPRSMTVRSACGGRIFQRLDDRICAHRRLEGRAHRSNRVWWADLSAAKQSDLRTRVTRVEKHDGRGGRSFRRRDGRIYAPRQPKARSMIIRSARGGRDFQPTARSAHVGGQRQETRWLDLRVVSGAFGRVAARDEEHDGQICTWWTGLSGA